MVERDDCISGYGARLPETLEALPGFQMPTERELAEVNSWFAPYIFYKTVKGGRRITTTCCGQREVIYPALERTQTPELWALMRARHNDTAVCPFCGRQGTVKCAGRTRDSFRREVYEPVVFLREKEGGLMAMAAWARKRYLPGAEQLGPEFKITYAYSFKPDRVDATCYWFGGREERLVFEGDYRPRKQRIREPFTDGYGCMFSYVSYRVIGLDAIGKSAFRYCGYERFVDGEGTKHNCLMGFLGACCFYPRDVEMLLKSGAGKMVWDLVYRGCKNADVYKWGAADVKKAFELDGQELRAFAAENYDLDLLKIYKYLRRNGFRYSFALAKEIDYTVPGGVKGFQKFMQRCRHVGQEPTRVMRWLSKKPPCARYSITRGQRYKLWTDYLDFCAEMGYDLKDETVALPKDFMRRHDEAAAAAAEKQRIELERRQLEKEREYAESLENRALKYDFAMDGLFIRVARTHGEVVAEGNVLKHCVGGYAARHIEGKTTILFLREAEHPERPLVTVEMDGDQLRQAHGYRNDVFGQSPLVTYKAFFDTWRDWLKRGSPRKKDGTPKLRKKKGTEAA